MPRVFCIKNKKNNIAIQEKNVKKISHILLF